jgi:hypothetical protein
MGKDSDVVEREPNWMSGRCELGLHQWCKTGLLCACECHAVQISSPERAG